MALAVRIAGGIVAVGCFLAGLWFVFKRPGYGATLIGLGLVSESCLGACRVVRVT